MWSRRSTSGMYFSRSRLVSSARSVQLDETTATQGNNQGQKHREKHTRRSRECEQKSQRSRTRHRERQSKWRASQRHVSTEHTPHLRRAVHRGNRVHEPQVQFGVGVAPRPQHVLQQIAGALPFPHIVSLPRTRLGGVSDNSRAEKQFVARQGPTQTSKHIARTSRALVSL